MKITVIISGVLFCSFVSGCAYSNGRCAIAVGMPIEAHFTKPTYAGNFYYDLRTGVPTIHSKYYSYEDPPFRN